MSIPKNILGIKLYGEYYAFDGDKIEQILRVPSITPIPLCDKGVIGVSSISGKITTILDTSIGIGGDRIESEKATARVLTILFENSLYGLLVDEVLVMSSIDEHEYEEVHKGNDKIVGFYKHDGVVYQIIDESKIIGSMNLLKFTPKNIDILSSSSENSNSTVQTNSTQRCLFLNLSTESFAINLDITREIIFVPEKITPVQEAGFGVLGAIVLREELITAVDLRALMGFESAAITRENRLLILNVEGKSLALLVDKIEEVKEIENSLIESMPNHFNDTKIESIYKGKEGISSILDKKFLTKIVNDFYIEDNNTTQELKDDMIAVGESVEIAVFSIGEEEYAIGIEDVQEIIKYSKETPVPEAPQFVDGIINLRGMVIPIFSLPERLGFEKNIIPTTKILVCNIHSQKVGLMVDDVNEIMFIESNLIAPTESQSTLFEGVIILNDGKRVILKLRTDTIMTNEDASNLEECIQK